MAFISYQGQRRPSALDDLVTQGILPSNPQQDEYSWDVYNDDACGNEEVLTTPRCVVWSREGIVRRLLQFDFEKQSVQHAVLTWFASRPTKVSTSSDDPAPPPNRLRALVVILEHHACIHYLDGPNHIVHMPFSVEKAYPLPLGVLLLRKSTSLATSNQTPLIPSAPPNSFFSPLGVRGSFGHGRSAPASDLLGVWPKKDPLLQDYSPRVWILVDPLEDLGVVIQERVTEAASIVSITVPHDQRLLYVSNAYETQRLNVKHQQLVIAVTLDSKSHEISVWHAHYTHQEDESSASSRRQRRRSSRARRRSSHGFRASTGLNTPRLRQSDHFKDSIKVGSHSNINTVKTAPDASQKSQDASARIEPSFDMLEDDTVGNDRRASSLIARAELSHGEYRSFSDMGKPHPGPGMISGTQQGASGDPRRSHGSFRRSMRLSASAGFRLEDVDEQMQLDFEEEFSEYPLEDRDTLSEKMTWSHIKSLPLSEVFGSDVHADGVAKHIKIFTWVPLQRKSKETKLSVFIVNAEADVVLETQLKFNNIPRRDEQRSYMRPSKDVVVNRLPYSDALRINDESIHALVMLSRRPTGFFGSVFSCSPSFRSTSSISDAGYSELLQLPGDHPSDEGLRLLRACRHASFDAEDTKGRVHGFKVCLAPLNPFTRSLLDLVIEARESEEQSEQTTRSLYWKSLSQVGVVDEVEKEFFAVIITVLATVCSIIFKFKRHMKAASGFFDSRQIHSGWNELDTLKAHENYKASWIQSSTLASKRRMEPSWAQHASEMCIMTAKTLAREVAEQIQLQAAEDVGVAAAQFTEDIVAVYKLLAALHTIRERQKLGVTLPAGQDTLLLMVILQLAHWLGDDDWLPANNRMLANEVKFSAWPGAMTGRNMDEFGILAMDSWSKSTLDSSLPSRILAVKAIHPCSIFDAIQAQTRGSIEAIVPFAQGGIIVPASTIGPIISRNTPLMNNLLQGFQAFATDSRDANVIASVTSSLLGDGPNRTTTSMVTDGLNALFGPRIQAVAGDEQDHGGLSQQSPDISQDISTVESHVPKDIHDICATEQNDTAFSRVSIEARTVIQSLFRVDKRFTEAKRLLDPLRVAVAEIQPRPGSTEAMFLEDQKALAQNVYKRTMAIPSGQAALRFSTYQPMLTEKLTIPSFNTSCNMQPSNNTVMASQANFTEEKVCWAFFHAGVNTGLRISKDAPGINTSWLVLNKPHDLGNRHAGFLLALGLNGHLKDMARWLSFKYLTPKHNMTTIGLILGLAASHLGSMDTMITRLLSVHVIRLLPVGTAELNLSPLTQTAGVIGIGLLYYNSEHRRMSEVMISEIEHFDDSSDQNTSVKDEGYRLAAGISLGMINLARGRSHTTDGLHTTERLLAIATGTKETANVHVLDQATAGATIALALIFMKTNDEAVAQRIAVPPSSRQFDFIRPDLLCLRTLAKNLIMWDYIQPTEAWLLRYLPSDYRGTTLSSSLEKVFQGPDPFSSDKIPFYNITTGLCLSIGLKHTGTADTTARDTLLQVLASVMSVSLTPTKSFDHNLTKDSIIRLQYTVALCLAAIMAGTGDLVVFRRLRALYAAVHEETSFGHHQAATTAIGILFLGSGRFTLSRSALGVASILVAFYPIFPKDVLDNRAHLQALRHFWVFAAEPRALIVRDAHTGLPIVAPATAVLTNGTSLHLEAPVLLPELDSISTLTLHSSEHHPQTLSFADADTLAAFKRTQTVHLTRKTLSEQHPDQLTRSLALLLRDPAPRSTAYDADIFARLIHLPAFTDLNLGASDVLDILGPCALEESADAQPVGTLLDARVSRVDRYLTLASVARGGTELARLEDLKTLIVVAGFLMKEGREVEGFSDDWVRRLKGVLEERVRRERAAV